MKRTRWTMAALLLLAGCATPPGEPPPFRHLDVEGGTIRTAPPLAFRIQAPAGFRAAGPSHRLAAFGGHPFEVSIAALLGEGEAVMAHAERVTDGSGASNYDSLPRSGWPTPAFGRRGDCLTVTPDMAAGEHDLRWLRERGWDLAGASVAMEQHLATTPGHDREIVITLLVRGVDCSDEGTVRAALDRLRTRIAVRPLR